MTPTYRRFIAALGAAFAILATGLLTAYFFKMDLWGGALGIASVFCYIIAFGMLFLVRLNDRKEKEDKERFNFKPPENNDIDDNKDSSSDKTSDKNTTSNDKKDK